MKALNVTGPYVLVGHQNGSMNMQIFAARALARGEDVRAVIHLDPYCLDYDDDIAKLGSQFVEMRKSVSITFTLNNAAGVFDHYINFLLWIERLETMG